MASVTFVDSVGEATVSNTKLAPGNRFRNWTPRPRPVGPIAVGKGTGRIHRFKYRDDDSVSFDIEGIPSTELDKVYRLMLHLMNGGKVTLDAAEHALYSTFDVCTLLPDTEPQLSLTDSKLVSYTLSLVLRADSAAPDDPFYPAFVPGLKLWLKASSLAASKVDDDFVSTWTDSSGNGNHAVQPDGTKQPRFKDTAFGGGPAVQFSFGTSDHLLTPAIINPCAAGATLFLVAYRDRAHVEHNNFLGLADSSGENASFTRIVETHSGDARDQVYVTFTSGGPISDWYASGSARGLGSSVSPFALCLSILDQTSITPYYGETARSLFDPDNGLNRSTRVVVGRDNVISGNTGNNLIAEILFYEGVLSSLNRGNITRYLIANNGVTV